VSIPGHTSFPEINLRYYVRRSVGKLANLEKALNGASLNGIVGIGHTRWATHGKPSEQNAHPHRSGPLALVHNGIIENYATLKEGLQKGGYRFESETDTEVMAHLIARSLKAGLGLEEAVRAATGAVTAADHAAEGPAGVAKAAAAGAGFSAGARCASSASTKSTSSTTRK